MDFRAIYDPFSELKLLPTRTHTHTDLQTLEYILGPCQLARLYGKFAASHRHVTAICDRFCRFPVFISGVLQKKKKKNPKC